MHFTAVLDSRVHINIFFSKTYEIVVYLPWMFMALITNIHLQDVCFSVFTFSSPFGRMEGGRKSIFPARSAFCQLENVFHLLSDGTEIFFFPNLLLFKRANPIPVIICYLGCY